MSKQTNKMKINGKYTWASFSQSYFAVAKLSCREMIEQQHNEKLSDTKYSRYSKEFSIHDLYIPTVYNIKHGIEIFSKTLKIILSENIDKNHNISELFDILENEVKKHKIVEDIKKMYNDNPGDLDIEMAYSGKFKISIFLSDIKKLINKYYYLEILRNKLDNNFVIEDIDNTAFRYPENSLKIKIDYDKILDKINKKDIEEMLKDVEVLISNFNELAFIFNVYKNKKNKK